MSGEKNAANLLCERQPIALHVTERRPPSREEIRNSHGVLPTGKVVENGWMGSTGLTRKLCT